MAHPPRPWGRAALWLAFLGPFFYLSYGTANWLASRRTDVPCIVFGWERQIPFLPWTILPYWTENLFYASALFLCLEPREVDILGRRMLTAQVVAVSCFILFPLAFSFPQPAVTGWPAFLFDALRGFDRPFNQAPSLHVALAIVLGVHFHRLAARRWRPLVVGWFLLIIGSVLTTYQHHFVDIPTGALLGWFCLWAWPDTGQSPMRAWRFHREASRWKQAAYYTGGALLAATLGIVLWGWAGWLLWPAVSLALVALNHVGLGAVGFQKGSDGRLSLAARWLFAPYLWAARLNSWLWTRARPQPDEVMAGVWLGRAPIHGDDVNRFTCLVDLSAELSVRPGHKPYRSIPILDFSIPAPLILAEAAEAIEGARKAGPVLVFCALGRSRSAAAVCSWLLREGRVHSAREAIDRVARCRPVSLSDEHLRAIEGSLHATPGAAP
ncbi:MAG: phosphatase PAP2/dual specificity phosphatase family protein [Holophagaceae bacterium]|nr:phosphatase PAP2/dual specificity phosphatase family protein [Holophagaceae bacterium]